MRTVSVACCLSFLLLISTAGADVNDPSPDWVSYLGEAARVARSAQGSLSVSGDLQFVHLLGLDLRERPPTRVTYRRADGRSLTLVDGIDADAGSPPFPAVSLSRLFVSGGSVEVLDRTRGSLEVERQAPRDPLHRFSRLTPHEFEWGFCGGAIEAFLRLELLGPPEVSGESPEREVMIRTRDSGGSVQYELVFVEAWNWLPRLKRFTQWRNGFWREAYRVEVATVHHTRLGTFPRSGTLTVRKPPEKGAADAGALYPVETAITAAWREPDFVNVTVPRTLVHDVRTVRRYGGGTIPVGMGFDDRCHQLDTWVGRIGDASLRGSAMATLVRAGTPLPLYRRPYVLYAISAAMAALSGVLLLFRRRRTLSVLALAGAGLVAAGAALLLDGPRNPGLVSGREWLVRGDSGSESASALCGIDCLYAVSQGVRDRHQPGVYGRLFAILRPGMRGISMRDIQFASEALGIPCHAVDLATYSSAPSPLIVHRKGGHFVVVFLDDQSALVLDPSCGVWRGPPEELFAESDEAALWFPGWRPRS